MRQIFVLAVLLALMRGVSYLGELDASAEAGDPLTLAAIGFVLLTSFTVAELGARLRLPKVTGYIVAGIVLGPYVSNILSPPVVVDMQMFNTLALGLIATTAGLELDARGIGRLWRTLGATSLVKVVLLPLLVGGAFYGLQRSFHFLPIADEASVIGLAVVFSALAIGTSPAISLAILSETRAKGRLADLVLGIAVLKDVVVVVCLAIAIAIARGLGGGGEGIDAAMFLHVAQEIGASIAGGLVLGGLLYLYIRFVGAEMLLFVAAMILVVAELSQALHLEILLVFIVAGFVIRNFTRHEHDLHHPLSVVSLPVFVVFFTRAGAGVNLDVTLQILPLALTLCFARGLAFWVAARVGAIAGGDPPPVKKVAWLAYLPQAGVTLGLVGVAAQQLPAYAEVIANTGMAVVAINLLIGPITLRYALRAAGEIPEPSAAQPELAAESSNALSRQAVADALEAPPARPTLECGELEAQVVTIEAAIRARVGELVSDEIEPWIGRVRGQIAVAFAPTEDREAAIAALLRVSLDPIGGSVDERVQALRAVFDDLRALCADLPVELSIPAEERFVRAQPEDSVFGRLRKLAVRVGHALLRPGRPRLRVVPLRMSARVTIEPQVARSLDAALGQWGRAQAQILVELRQLGQGVHGPRQAEAAVDGLLEVWLARFQSGFERALAHGLHDLAQTLAVAGSRELPARRIRYSRVEPAITGALQAFADASGAWSQRLGAAQGTLRLALLLERLELHVSRVVEAGFLVPLGRLLDSLEPEVLRTRERMGEGEALARGWQPGDAAGLDALAGICRRAFPQDSHAQIRQLRAEFKQNVSAHDLGLDIRSLVEALPESTDVLAADASLHLAQRPTEVAIFTIPLRRICEQALIHELLPGVDEHLREANLLANTINAQLREHVGVAAYAVDVVQRGHVRGRGEPQALMVDAFERALRRLDELGATIRRMRDQTLARVRDERGRAFEGIRADAARRRRDRGPARAGGLGLRLRRRIEAGVRRLAGGGVALGERLLRLYRRLRAREHGGELQQRIARSRLDAVGLRALLHLDVRRPEARGAALPPIYGRLFALEALHERRFFTARRVELRALMRAEGAWLEGQGPNGVLLVGRHGSGRSSLLNVAQLELAAKRVVRVGDDDDRGVGLLAAIADELRCSADLVELRVALRAVKTTVIIDDLESWLRPDPAGVRAFERFLDVVIATRDDAFWVAAVEEDALALVDPLVALRQAFAQTIVLGPLDGEALGRVVEARHRVSGLDVSYPAGRVARLLRRRGDASRRAFFRDLARASHGNLREALRAWQREVEVVGDTVVAGTGAPAVAGVRWLDQLHPHALAVLVHAARFGDLAVELLADVLALSADEVRRHLAFLEAAGLVEDLPGGYGVKRIPPEVQPTVLDALRRAGALPREVA